MSIPNTERLTVSSILQSGPDQTLAAALRYAAAGLPVFPTRPDEPSCPGGPECECKAPLTRHGFHDASTSPGRIRGWWHWWPAANVALATGAPGRDVLDVDQHGDAGNGFAAFNRLNRAGMLAGATALVRTPSGGIHVYFTGTGQGCGKLPRHHLDFKAAGGYVLAPPSRVHGRAYVLLDHRAGTARLDWAAVCGSDPAAAGTGQATGRQDQRHPPGRVGRRATRGQPEQRDVLGGVPGRRVRRPRRPGRRRRRGPRGRSRRG